MGSYEAMKAVIEKTGIYRVDKGTNISSELYACACGFDDMQNELEEIQREYYIDTAQTYGITKREIFLGKERTELSINHRREMLKAEEQQSGGCTPLDFKIMLKGYGLVNFEIKENFSGQAVVIDVSDSLTDEEKELIEKRAAADFPVHLDISFNYLS